jgi:tetratricopeptide (TPR) repeat protein
MKKITFIIFILLAIKVIGQTKKIDSLQEVISQKKSDTAKATILNELAFEYRTINPDTAIYFARQALSFSQSNHFEIGEAEAYTAIGIAHNSLGESDDALLLLLRAKRIFEKIKPNQTNNVYRIKKYLSRNYNTMGNIYMIQGNYPLSLKTHQEALNLRIEINDKTGVASSYNNIANIYYSMGNYNEAIKNHFASLKIKESLGNKQGIAISYNNIGIIYKDQGNNEQAIKHLKNSLKIAEEIKYEKIITTNYINIGTIYLGQLRYEEAMNNFKKAYQICKQNNDKEDLADVLGNMGSVYNDLGNYEEALKKEFEALKIKEELNEKRGISAFQNLIGKIYLNQGDLKNAIIYCEKSLDLAVQMKHLKQIQETSQSLISIYQKTGNYKQAFEMQNLYLQSTDSIVNKDNQLEAMRQEFQYNYQKQSIADSLNYANEKKIVNLENQAKLKTERSIKISLLIGLILVVVFALFISNRFRITKRQKNIIEHQSRKLEVTHHQLAEKTKEIKDSIQYSKEIQNTFLKSPSDSKKYFKDTLLVYKPKDVVSGDFYWYKELNDNLYVVVGDSTGHGVPGAIISVLAIQSLEKTILQIKDNNQLHLLNELMKVEFNHYYKLDGHVSIGLDYSIICINKKENKLYISGSGANVFVKNKTELLSYKFDTINIGGQPPAIYEPETICLDLNSILSVFLFTDGIVDQKGFLTGKKYGSKRLKELILNLNTNDTGIATKKIETEINNWMGNLEQIDDITLLGIQIHQA